MNLENKIPTPIIALVVGIIISASSAIIKPFNIYGIEFVAIVIMAGSFLIIILSINKFKKENTTINPMDPTQTIKLVATGTFALSRNPMYLGLAGILIGMERRKESYTDDRDPYLDGTVKNQDCCGVTSATLSFPFTSGVLGSSPTIDVSGTKRVNSTFVEMVLPITDKLDAQIAVRNEDFSDTESTMVSRLAAGYTFNDIVKVRASVSTAFRSPNILQINQPFVTRTGTRVDAVQEYRIYSNNKLRFIYSFIS